jgi:hypothetical protein
LDWISLDFSICSVFQAKVHATNLANLTAPRLPIGVE